MIDPRDLDRRAKLRVVDGELRIPESPRTRRSKLTEAEKVRMGKGLFVKRPKLGDSR